jgi:uncharacterized membrane protein YeaQ/YmgE (transglycosylase-associated protein family)
LTREVQEEVQDEVRHEVQHGFLHKVQHKEKRMQFFRWMLDSKGVRWFAGKSMARERCVLLEDMSMGAAGAIAGGFLFTSTHVLVRSPMIYTNLCALVGAVVLVSLHRLGARREQIATN